eukprot:359703-Chlamydomonas_euryale.AAC.4
MEYALRVMGGEGRGRGTSEQSTHVPSSGAPCPPPTSSTSSHMLQCPLRCPLHARGTHAHPPAHMHTLTHTCAPSHTHAHPHAHMHALPHTCTPSHTHAHPHARMHALPHTCTPSRTHAYPPARASAMQPETSTLPKGAAHSHPQVDKNSPTHHNRNRRPPLGIRLIRPSCHFLPGPFRASLCTETGLLPARLPTVLPTLLPTLLTVPPPKIPPPSQAPPAHATSQHSSPSHTPSRAPSHTPFRTPSRAPHRSSSQHSCPILSSSFPQPLPNTTLRPTLLRSRSFTC